MPHVIDLILLFFTCAFAGWCMEVILKYRQFHRFINRGFLTGPWLPIYGFGAVLITLSVELLSPYESSYGTTFMISFVVCGMVEYFASFFLEKIYHARWWDYSQKPMNLHGRIWIGNLVLFGLAGVGITYLVNPLLSKVFGGMSLRVRTIIAGILLAVFLVDLVVSLFVMKLVKAGVERSTADNTEDVNKEIRMLLSDRNYFYRRFADAYPNVIYNTERIAKRMAEIKAESERLRRELADKKDQFMSNFELTGTIKNDIIQRQGELISRLYQDDAATDEERVMKRELDARMEKLRRRPGGMAQP